MGHTHRYQLCFKKKKNQVKSPSPESSVPETGSDPPIGSDRESGRDRVCPDIVQVLLVRILCKKIL